MKVHFDCHIDKKLSGCSNNPSHTINSQKLYLVLDDKNQEKIYNICNGYLARAKKYSYFKKISKPIHGPIYIKKCISCNASDNGKLNFYNCGMCVKCCTHYQCQHSDCFKCFIDLNNSLCKDCEFCKSHCDCERCTGCDVIITDFQCEDCDKCLNCCSCIYCFDCENRSNDLCRDCGCCSLCCNCNFCDTCGEVSTVSLHSGCHQCVNCCECQTEELNNLTMPTIRNVNAEDLVHGTAACSHEPLRANNPINRKIFNCERLVGVEWEYNSLRDQTPLINWTNKWRAGNHYDGSCGREVVTPPIAGDFIVKCLSELGEAFKTGGASIDTRCGIHVHVDTSDFNWDDMMRLLKTYALVEPVLYAVAGHQRTSNRYCMPCGASYLLALKQDDPKGAILNVAYGTADGRRHRRKARGKKDGLRYRGLNLVPWLAGRGVRKNGVKANPDTTVEFRIHKNSNDAAQVSGWARICAKLVDWSYKASNEEVNALPKSPTRALTKIIAPDMSSWVLDRLKQWRAETKNSAQKTITYDHGRYDITGMQRFVNEDASRAQLEIIK